MKILRYHDPSSSSVIPANLSIGTLHELGSIRRLTRVPSDRKPLYLLRGLSAEEPVSKPSGPMGLSVRPMPLEIANEQRHYRG